MAYIILTQCVIQILASLNEYIRKSLAIMVKFILTLFETKINKSKIKEHDIVDDIL